MKKLFLIIILFSSYNCLAQIHFYSDYTFSNIGISSDIIIHAPATVTFTGDITMLDNLSITVEDGGFAVFTNGTIHKLAGQGNWQGVIVEPVPLGSPSTGYAITATNFTFRDAKDAIESGYLATTGGTASFLFHNRKMSFNDVVFEENDRHFILGNEILEADLVNLSLSKTLIQFNNTYFGRSYQIWPIHILKTAGLKFNNCTFNDLSSVQQMSVHLNTFNRGGISNCSFLSNSEYHVSLHGSTTNSNISNNTFSFENVNTEAGVEIAEFMSGTTTDLTISNNTFKSLTFKPNTWGIGGDNHSGTSQTGITIKNNQFKNLLDGILAYRMLESSVIEENIFESCGSGIKFIGQNDDVTVQCNRFINNQLDILISSGALLMDHNFSNDPNNSFTNVSGTLNLNILNNGTQTFYYSYSTAPPSVGSNIVLNQVGTKRRCGASDPVDRNANFELEKNQITDSQIHAYPSPTTNSITIESENLDTSFSIVNQLGQVILKGTIDNEKQKVDLSPFADGVYMLCLGTKKIRVVKE